MAPRFMANDGTQWDNFKPTKRQNTHIRFGISFFFFSFVALRSPLVAFHHSDNSENYPFCGGPCVRFVAFCHLAAIKSEPCGIGESNKKKIGRSPEKIIRIIMKNRRSLDSISFRIVCIGRPIVRVWVCVGIVRCSRHPRHRSVTPHSAHIYSVKIKRLDGERNIKK